MFTNTTIINKANVNREILRSSEKSVYENCCRITITIITLETVVINFTQKQTSHAVFHTAVIKTTVTIILIIAVYYTKEKQCLVVVT